MVTAGPMLMRTEAEAGQILASWTSPAYPTGAFAYSHGLEQVISGGAVSDPAGFARWGRAVLRRGAGRSDAILVNLAHGAAAPELDHLSDIALSLAASAERAHEAGELGAAFARTTAEVWGTDPQSRPYPVAFGAAAAALELPQAATVRFYLLGFVANLVSAAVRFLPMGQTDGQRITAELLTDIEEVAAETRQAGIEDIGTSVFAADLAAIEHETLDVRIFRT